MSSSARIQGLIEAGAIADVLQFIAGKQGTRGVLTVKGPLNSGSIWINHNMIVSAQYGPYNDRDAILHMMALSSGHYSFSDEDKMPDVTMGNPLVGTLMSCAKDLDEFRDPNMAFELDETDDGLSLKFGSDDEDPVILPFSDITEDPIPVEKTRGELSEEREEAEEASIPVKKRSRSRNKISVLRAAALAIVIISGVVFGVTHMIKKENRNRDEIVPTSGETQLQQQIDSLLTSGNLLMADGLPEAALTNYFSALEMSPEDETLRVLVTKTEERIARKAREHALRSERERERVRQLQRSAELQRRVEELIEHGNNSRANGDLDKALAHYKGAQTLVPDDSNTKSTVAALIEELEARREEIVGREQDARQQRIIKQRLARRLAAADQARRAGLLAKAEAVYVDVGSNEEFADSVTARNERLNQHRVLRKKLGDKGLITSVEITVASSTVANLELPDGSVVDMYVTANAGLLRIGRMNSFGVASELWYTNPQARPVSLGTFNFSRHQCEYTVAWRKFPGEGRMTEYVIALGKSQKQLPTADDEG